MTFFVIYKNLIKAILLKNKEEKTTGITGKSLQPSFYFVYVDMTPQVRNRKLRKYYFLKKKKKNVKRSLCKIRYDTSSEQPKLKEKITKLKNKKNTLTRIIQTPNIVHPLHHIRPFLPIALARIPLAPTQIQPLDQTRT